MRLELVIILLSLIRNHASRIRRSSDVSCNVETRFECFCHVDDGDDDESKNSCQRLITTQTLSILRLILSKFGNLDALSPEITTAFEGRDVTYENYFRINLAKILTRFCAKDARQCPHVGFPVRPERVIVLKTSIDEKNRLIVEYCVANSWNVHELRPDSLIDAELILNATKGELEKVIPYPIFDHSKSIFVREINVWKENLGLITALLAFACILVFIYVVAVVKALRDRSRSLQGQTTSQSKKNSCPTTGPPRSTQYGSTDHRSPPDGELEIAGGTNYQNKNAANDLSTTLELSSETEKLIRNGPNQSKLKPRTKKIEPVAPSKKLVNSKSLENEISGPRKINRFKKSNTCVFAMQNEKKGNEIDFELTDKKNDKFMRIPVLIVPAMSKIRNDGDYANADDRNEKSIFDNAISESISEEQLLSNGHGSMYSSNSSIDSINRESPEISTSDVKYRPLANSNWSVNMQTSVKNEELNLNFQIE